MTDNKTQEQVRIIKKLLKYINRAWSSGHPEDLSQYFHDEIKIISPTGEIVGNKKEVCIKSYVDFINTAEIKNFKDGDPDVFVFGDTAIAIYTYRMAWVMQNQSYEEHGQELYVLTFMDGKWLVVMRKVIPNT